MWRQNCKYTFVWYIFLPLCPHLKPLWLPCWFLLFFLIHTTWCPIYLTELCSFLHMFHIPPPPAAFTSFWLPPTPSRQTHTASSFSFFLTLISQGSTPVLLLFLLMTYFASGFCLSPTSTPLSCLLLSSFLFLPITPSGNFTICF